MIKITIYLIVILLLLASCGNSKNIIENSTTTLIKVDNLEKSKGKFVSLQQIADEISFVNLVTPSETPLSEVSKLIEFNDQIFISDQKQKTIFVFDNKGQFIRRIGRNGKGPGEIVDITDFYISTLDSCVIISDIGKKEILKFNQNGSFLSSVKTSLVGKCIMSLSPSSNALYSGFSSEYNLAITNDKYEPIHNLFPVTSHMAYAPIMQNSQAFSCNYKGEILFLPSYSNYVYSITPNEVKIKFKFDFCNNQLPEKYIQKNFNGNTKNIRDFYSLHLGKTDFAYSPFSFIEDREHLFFQFSYDNRRIYSSIIFKNSNFNIVTCGWCLDKNELVKIRGGFKNLHNGCLVGFFYPYDMVESIDKLSTEARDDLFKELPDLKEFYYNKELSDNPSIIKCKLKSYVQ